MPDVTESVKKQMPAGLDKRGKFAPGNKLGSLTRKPKKRGSIEGLRQDVLDHWANGDALKVLTKIKNEKPVEYAKLITALAPKQADTAITRNVLFNLYAKAPPPNWKGLTEDEDVLESGNQLPATDTPDDSQPTVPTE